jgi:hypothetical protein
MNEDNEERWIGKGGPVALPAQSPNLYPLHSFLWGCMKSKMHHNGKPRERHQSIKPIDEAVAITNKL